jgi:hypothetical protein
MNNKFYLFVLVCFVYTSCVYSQVLKEFSVSVMPTPDVPLVQGNVQFPEDALLLVYSPLKELNFRSSMGAIDKMNYNPDANRYEIFIKPLKQMIFVFASDYIEAKMETFTPSPKEVYYYKIEENLVNSLKMAEPGILTLSSEPTGAEIYLNSVKIADKTPFKGELPGAVKIKLSKIDYEDFDTTTVIRPKEINSLNIKLKPTFRMIHLTSEPSGAFVYFDNQLIGETPLKHQLNFKKGTLSQKIQVRLQMQNYDELNDAWEVIPGVEPYIKPYSLVKKQGYYTITSNPPGAMVYINQNPVGYTPARGKIEYGTHEVEVVKEGYEKGRQSQMTVFAENADTVNFQLALVKTGEKIFTFQYTAYALKYKKDNRFALDGIGDYIRSNANGYGTYKVKVKYSTDDLKNSSYTLQSYRSAGPACAFYSMLMPGWGASKVSYGKKGKWMKACFMSFTVLTIGAKVLSDQSFNKYLQASSQSESDKLYSEANVLHQAALVSAGLAASFYVYDIIRVFRYGVKNKLKSRAYKKMLRNTPVMINP